MLNMGRITVFTTIDCPHCKRAKAALDSRDIPYIDISLSSYPSKRVHMLSLADRLTVPQFFFNERHIGGADETLKIIEQWDNDAEGRTPRQIYEEEIALEPDFEDERFDVPDEPPVGEPVALPRPSKDCAVELPGKYEGTDGVVKEESDSVLNVTKKLMEIIPHKNLNYIMTTYACCFRASDGVTAIQEAFDLPTREAAVAFGKYLQTTHGIFHHVCNEHFFKDTPNLFFRLQPFHTPNILNTFRIWTERVDTANPLGVVERCRRLLEKIDPIYSDKAGNFNYMEARNDPLFFEFEEAVCELQGIDLAKMDESTKLAFCINVYNLMIKHAFVKVGIPSSPFARNAFFGGVKYVIGGFLFSFSDLEHGIIRSNCRAPYCLSRPLSKNDPRIGLICKKLDPRIHFALNCGAKSCPPVEKFTSEAIDEELRIVAQAYCEQDTSVKVDEDNMELHLSPLFHWYRYDFTDSSDTLTLAESVLKYLRGEKKAKLERMIEHHKDWDSLKLIEIVWLKYNWTSDASEKVDFVPASLNAQQNTLASYLNCVGSILI